MWHELANSNNLIGLVAVTLTMGMPIIIVVAALVYKAHKATMLRETIQYMIDKGQPVPPEWLQSGRKAPSAASAAASALASSAASSLYRGIIMIAAGIGLLVMFLSGPESFNRLWGVAMVPLLVGAAYLLIWRLDRGSVR